MLDLAIASVLALASVLDVFSVLSVAMASPSVFPNVNAVAALSGVSLCTFVVSFTVARVLC